VQSLPLIDVCDLFRHAPARVSVSPLLSSGRVVSFLCFVWEGLNAVIGSLVRSGTRVLVLEVGYGSVKKMVACRGGVVTIVQLPIGDRGGDPLGGPSRDPLDGDAVVAAVADALEKAKSTDSQFGLAIFDAVTSNTALRLPVQRLAQLCRSYGHLVVASLPLSLCVCVCVRRAASLVHLDSISR
jgi:hypothetical protein